MFSIMQDMESDRRCRACGRSDCLERHHVFGGAYRRKSEREGLVVWLCHWCHNEPPFGVHHNRERMDALRAEGERAWLDKNGATVEDFIREFGRNYL